MAATSQETGAAASEIATAVGDVATGAERQARSVDAVRARRRRRPRASPRESVERAREAARAADEARDVARAGAAPRRRRSTR